MIPNISDTLNVYSRPYSINKMSALTRGSVRSILSGGPVVPAVLQVHFITNNLILPVVSHRSLVHVDLNHNM